MKIFKKFDFVIILSLLILSFVPHFIFGKTLAKDYNSSYVSIEISGKHYKDIPLSNKDNTLIIETPRGNNTVVVKNNSIQITEADCHDDLCVKQGIISKVGESIICLPHELVIEIKGDNDSSSDDMILSH
ncbi:NusG domain II-containing protein [Romboutsia sp.]|uniref:NusG domain II-containing protein n=1 Tax=Romboutsia sp. TaxID=1965302 RepID=UPI003F346D78